MERLLGLLGLGLRAGTVVVGVDGARAVLQRGDAALVVMAEDASARARGKVAALAAAKRIPTVSGPAAEEIGRRLGRPPVMVAVVRDRRLAAGMLEAAAARDGT